MKIPLLGLLATASAKNPNHDCIVQCQKDFFRAAFKCETLEGTKSTMSVTLLNTRPPALIRYFCCTE